MVFIEKWSLDLTVVSAPCMQDFYQMTLHHVVTLALVVTAYIINFMQLGVLILLIHDISDVPLEVYI